MTSRPDSHALIRSVCIAEDLATYDPYDIWKTPLGFSVKNLYNRQKLLALPFAALLTLFGSYVNNSGRLFYRRQEYPVVRATAALALLALFDRSRDETLLVAVRKHLNWLVENSCTGFHGPCWGLGFRYAVDRDLVYEPNTPLTTMTPYALEAFVRYTELSGDTTWNSAVSGIFEFLEHDVPILEETEDSLITAYSNQADRRVINAVSYVMYCYGLLHEFISAEKQKIAKDKIRKTYNFLVTMQDSDGSWPYSLAQRSFIDCFHSCFVLKNIIKTSRHFSLPNSDQVVKRGYSYVKENFRVPESGLFKRFAVTNKPGIVQYDLYDNAEMLNLAHLVGDSRLVEELGKNIQDAFVDGDDIYSRIEWPGIRRNKNTLRWAVLPYLYSLAVTSEQG